MKIEEVNKAMETKFAELKKQFDEAKSEVSAEEFKALEQKHTELQKLFEENKTADTLAEMQKHLDALDVKMQKGKGMKQVRKTFASEVKSRLEEKSIISSVEAMKRNSAASVNFELKAATDAITLDSYAGSILTTEVDRSISQAPRRMPYLRDLVNISTTTSNKVSWVNKEAQEGEAGMTAEGAKKSQISWTYTEESADVKKITAFVKVSKESLDDLDMLRSEINVDLREAIELKLDEELAEGDGLGQNLKGILTYAPTIDVAGTPFAASVSEANELDALRAAVALVKAERFHPTYVVINPLDAALMDLEKGNDGHYILPPFVTADGMRISGIRVIENEAIDEGTFLVGDFTKSILKIREEINVNVGYENDDFTKNMVTILAEMRAAHYIKKHNVKAFLKGTFATVISAMDEPVESI